MNVRGIVSSLALLLLPTLAIADCRADQVALRGDWGTANFSVDVADTDEKRAKGLMFVEKMPRFTGMLFVYDRPTAARFWMRNTLIPLDMLFVNKVGVVKSIKHEAVPHDETIINGGFGILAVLEINGGLAKKLGITPGSELRHPAFGAAAAWSCTSE